MFCHSAKKGLYVLSQFPACLTWFPWLFFFHFGAKSCVMWQQITFIATIEVTQQDTMEVWCLWKHRQHWEINNISLCAGLVVVGLTLITVRPGLIVGIHSDQGVCNVWLLWQLIGRVFIPTGHRAHRTQLWCGLGSVAFAPSVGLNRWQHSRDNPADWGHASGQICAAGMQTEACGPCMHRSAVCERRVGEKYKTLQLNLFRFISSIARESQRTCVRVCCVLKVSVCLTNSPIQLNFKSNFVPKPVYSPEFHEINDPKFKVTPTVTLIKYGVLLGNGVIYKFNDICSSCYRNNNW